VLRLQVEEGLMQGVADDAHLCIRQLRQHLHTQSTSGTGRYRVANFKEKNVCYYERRYVSIGIPHLRSIEIFPQAT
jgi:hypothetical protein